MLYKKLYNNKESAMNELSHMWKNIQGNLFPFLQEVLHPFTKQQKRLVSILEIIQIEDLVQAQPCFRGRPSKNRKAIARAFITKAVYEFSTTRQLIENLKLSSSLRRICGWERFVDVPSESVFSRVFAEFSKTELPQQVQEVMINKYLNYKIVGHLSRDSTAIVGREKAIKKPKKENKPKRKRGRPRKGEEVPIKEPTRLERQKNMTLDEMLKDLPKKCNFGTKKDSKGKKLIWKGYKLHVDFADGGIPISCVLTSASVHDSQVALPLAQTSANRVTSLYDLMDAAYDSNIIKEHSRSLGHVPIIDSNRRNGKKKLMCPATKIRYNERSTAERGFSRLKDSFGANTVRVKGHTKVMAHLMFGVLALCAEQLLRLII